MRMIVDMDGYGYGYVPMEAVTAFKFEYYLFTALQWKQQHFTVDRY